MRNLLQSARALCLKVLHFTIILITSLAILLSITNMQCAKYVGLLRTANAVTSNTTLEDKSGKNTKKKENDYENPHTKGIDLNILQATPVVTDKSGYHLTATVKSTTEALPEGLLQLSINSNYTFVSRTDLQNWAQGESLIPTPQILGSIKIGEVAAGKTSTFHFDIPSDSQELKSIWHWGPKPLKITYFSKDSSRYKSIRSFLTRSNAGFNVPESPAIKLTAVMPILANKQHVLKDNFTSTNSRVVANLQANKQDTHYVLEQADLVNKHNKLQTIADINTLQAARLLFVPNAFMQKSGFDISAYADDHNSKMYRSAGINESTWSAKNSRIPQTSKIPQSSQIAETSNSYNHPHETKQISKVDNGSQNTYAWQTRGKWTLSALELAKRNGYNTVISTDEFDATASQFAISNGIYDVETPAGDVRVLSAQSVLTMLANGKATSSTALSEHTQAGRINRLVAQSAFYQMEQPYVDRNILITFSNKTDVKNIDGVMSALEQSPWLQLSDLNTMAQIKQEKLPSWKNNDLMHSMPHSSAINAVSAKERRLELKNLILYRQKVSRFVKNILNYEQDTKLRNTEGDAQALAKQAAKAKNRINAKDWGLYLLRLYDDIALQELTNKTSSLPTKTKKYANRKQQQTAYNENSTAKYFVNKLLSGIRIIPPKDITAVSETASIPITISNTYAYPVKVYLSADTHVMEIVTRRKTLVKVPANSEVQVTLPLRITTSLHTKATFVLEDNQHQAFSGAQHTLITSTLQISDKSGTIIIIFAFMLGLLGLWRQFNRKKDSDE
ncbi:hypothetical protein CJI57_03190 [Bifidobacteriaceae bacterium WP012]|nr:hypothetical protein CJI57_03190 [Bifidobacteriaceae bacterium WP012]